VSQRLIPKGERSGLLTRIAMTEGPTRCADQKSRSGVEQRDRAGT